MLTSDSIPMDHIIASNDRQWPRLSARALYLPILLALPVLFVVIALPIARLLPSNSPLEGTAGYVNDYRYEMKHLDADIVIYGDSSATRNLDPLVIGQNLNMKVANIGGDAQSLQILRNTPVEYYLAFNKAPKVIVLAASSWDLIPAPVSTTNSFDGIMMIVRHYPVGQVVKYSFSHPLVMANFALQVMERVTYVQGWINRRSWEAVDEQLGEQMNKHSGFVPQGFGSKKATEPLDQSCTINMPLVDISTAPGTIATDFVQEFSSPQTKVFVYLSALPNCTGHERYTKLESPKAWLLPAHIVPYDSMVQDSALIHGRMTSTTMLSELASRSISDAIAKQPVIPAPSH